MNAVSPASIKQELQLSLREYNKYVARCKAIAEGLGSVVDGECLHQELANICEHLSKVFPKHRFILVSNLRNEKSESEERTEWEILYSSFTALLEYYIELLQRIGRLVDAWWQEQPGTQLRGCTAQLLVATGCSEAVGTEKRFFLNLPNNNSQSRKDSATSTSSPCNLTAGSRNSTTSESDVADASGLNVTGFDHARHCHDMQQVLLELHQSVNVAHWAVQAEVNESTVLAQDDDEDIGGAIEENKRENDCPAPRRSMEATSMSFENARLIENHKSKWNGCIKIFDTCF